MSEPTWILELHRVAPTLLWRSNGHAAGEDPTELEIAAAPEDPTAWAAAVMDRLAAHGYGGEDVLLAPAASLSLAVAWETPSAAQAAPPEACTYELERWLPWAAEEMVADFVMTRDKIFAVAVQLQEVLPQVEALEAVGVVVRAITPCAVLALMRHLQEAPSGDHFVLWRFQGKVELWRVEEGKPVVWRHIPAQEQQLRIHLRAIAAQYGNATPLVVYEPSQDIERLLWRAWPAERIERRALPLPEAAAGVARSVLAGAAPPLVELRRDGLAALDPWRPLRGGLRAAGVAAGIFLLALAAALLVRGQQLGSQVDRLDAAGEQAFRDVLPGQPVPVGKLSRLRSERDKLAGQLGHQSGLPQSPSALRMLHEVLVSLPTNVRFRLHEIRLEPGQLFLDGEVRQHADADLLARALRGRGFVVTSPRTQRLSDGSVSLRLRAQLPDEPMTPQEQDS